MTTRILLAWILLTASVFGQGAGSVAVVPNVAALTNRPPSALNPVVAVSGYRTNGDWGAARNFVYVPASTNTTDNGCIFPTSTGTGRWEASDCDGAALDPRWFGAIVGDLLDDSAALQATIDAAGSRASVRLPVGRLLLSTPLSYKDRIHIRGEGDGSMLAVTTTNGIAFWNGTPGTRIYEVFLNDFAINTGLGARGYAAITLTNVSYARLERLFVHAYDGLGFRIGVKPWGDSPSSVGGAWSSSMVGCKIYVYPRPGEPAYAFHGDGGPDWGHGPNSWRIIDNYLNCQPVIAGGITNYGTSVVYANNQNGIQLAFNIFEGYYTNSVTLETGAASSIIGNRFEVSYGIGGTNFAAVKMLNMTNVFIGGNMAQGLGDYTKYVRGVNSSYTLFDSASQSPNTVDGDLLVGKTWSVDDVGYLPTVTNYVIVGSKRNPEKLGIGLRTIDGTVNPRTIMTLNAEPGATDSWAGIFHGSSLATLPFYFYASITNLAITDAGIGVLGLPTVSSALSAYGNGAFGSSPSVAGGWTDMNEGVWVRTTDLSKRAGYHAIVNDGVTNRRIEMMVSKTNAAIRTTATTANLPLDFWVAGKNVFSLDSSAIKVKTNLVFEGLSSLYLGGDTITDFTGAGLSVVGGALTASTSDGDKGDVTVSGSGATWTIDADSVALGTDTTGNYVASVSGTANEVSASGSGEGAAVTVSLPATIDLGGKTSFELPNAAAPTVDAFGEIAGDDDAWGAGRGAVVAYDGTAATRLVGVLASDTPTAGQVPKWQTGGTITWEDDQTGAGGLSDGDKGDVTVSGSGATWTIDADSVALGTDTTGNYVASVSGTANEVSASGSGEGAAVTVSLPATIDLGAKTSFELPNAAAPTVDAFGEIAGDDDAWGAGRGAAVFYDGTAATRLVGVLASDTPTAGQVPKWQTGGTITWEDDQTGAGGLSDGDKGDVTVSGSGATWTIDADSVALGTDTTGNYVASVSGTANEVSASGSGEGAAVTVSLPATIDLGGKTSFELPNAAAPTVDAFGEIAGDDDAWGAGRGAVVAYDGTAATRLVGVLASDTPTAGQVPKWQTGGTITWEDDQTGAGGLSDGDKGDVTVSGSGATWTIDADSVALGTDTTGNYVASVAGTANEVSASGSGEGAAVTVSLPATIDLGSKTSFELPNAAAPTVDAFGEIAGDNDAWAAGRGAAVFYDGTAATRLVGVLSSDTPSNGQFPRWNTDGTITWENVPSVTNSPVTGLWRTLGSADIIVENTGTTSASVTYTNYSGIVTNLTQIGNVGSNYRLQLSLTFNESIGTNYLVLFDFDGSDDADSSYALAGWSQTSARSTSSCEVSIVNTDGFVYSYDGFKIRIRIVNPNATAGGSGGTGDVITTADNVLTGVNQFTNGLGQVFSVPPRVLGGRINGWTAPQMTPGTNAATQAQFKVLGDGIPTLEFDGATSEEISMVGLLSQDPDRGSFVTLTFASDDTANTVCWQAQWQLLTLRGIDTNLLSSAATWTSNIPGTARVPTNITFSLNAPSGLVGSTNDFSKPYMLRITRLPGSDSSLSNAYLIGVDHRYGL